MRNKVMEIVGRICKKESTDCRGLNKENLARDLMDLANIPQNAEIQEIPLDCGNQVVILFLMPNDKNYYCLFAGIGNNGKFYFELSITGILEGDYFHFFEEEGKEDQVLPIDYFVINREDQSMVSEYIKNLIKENPATSKYKYSLLDRMVMDCLYYLGNGNRQKKYLWSSDEAEHIANMKALWNSFPGDGKPEWLSMEDIGKFEKEMVMK